jgi:hypothetical protein
MHAGALEVSLLLRTPAPGWSAMTSDIGGVLRTLAPRIGSGAYRLMGLLAIVSAILSTQDESLLEILVIDRQHRLVRLARPR